jgi:hypothetical protein
MNERRPTSDELTNEDLRPNTKGKRLTTNEGRKEGRIPTTDKRTKKGSTNQPTKKGNDRQANEEGQQTCANLEGERRGIKSLERHNKFDEGSNPSKT